MAPVEDVRRWAAVRAAATGRLLLHAEDHLLDVEGAVDEADPELAAHFARSFVLEAISVAGLAGGGPLEHRPDDVNFDVFQGVDPDLVQRAFTLAVGPLEEGSSWDPAAWLDQLRAVMYEVGVLLGLDEPQP